MGTGIDSDLSLQWHTGKEDEVAFLRILSGASACLVFNKNDFELGKGEANESVAAFLYDYTS